MNSPIKVVDAGLVGSPVYPYHYLPAELARPLVSIYRAMQLLA